ELATRLHHTPQALTRTLAALQEQAFLERMPDPDDRRQALLTITSEGREAMREDMRPRDAWLAAVMAAELTEAERDLLVVASRFLLRGIIDHALPERSASLVTILAVGMLVAAVATAALGVLTTRLATVVGQNVMHDLRVGVYSHLQRMSLKFFTKARAGDLQS